MSSVRSSRWSILLCALLLGGLYCRADDKIAPARAQVYASGEVDRAPKAMFIINPVYPPDLKAQKIEGEVVIEAIVDLNGLVRDPIVKSSTRKEFEVPALQAAIKWKYRPGRKNKENVNVRVEIPIKFQLKK